MIDGFVSYRPKCFFNTPQEMKLIESRFENIPLHAQKEVSERYDSLFLKNKYGRTAANQYLAGVSNEWRILSKES